MTKPAVCSVCVMLQLAAVQARTQQLFLSYARSAVPDRGEYQVLEINTYAQFLSWAVQDEK